MGKKLTDNTSVEVLAAFLDGNATAEECQDILAALSDDAGLRELMHISQLVDAELGKISSEMEFLPMTALAANCNEENYCCLKCEKYVRKGRIRSG